MSVNVKISSKKSKRSGKTVPAQGRVYIKSTYNNCIVMIANAKGQKIIQESGGSAGFKNSRKSTSEAAEVAAKKAAEFVKARGMTNVDVKLNGFGPGREGAIRGLHVSGLTVSSLEDLTGIPHNGVKRKKRKRN